MENKNTFWNWQISIDLTWSKLMALAVLIAAVSLDYIEKGHSTFMYALPFIVFLITGKQITDMTKEIKNK